ncbi:MAG: hypothetical protein Q9222_000523 [Ikaeria aurantiellina]
MGGDILPGTDFVDALKVFEHHEETKGIILIGEIGGESELRAAEWIGEYKKRTEHPKPIMALVAGTQAPPQMVMGHAGAFFRTDKEQANYKIKALESVGVVMTNHPSKFGDSMKQLLGTQSSSRPSMSAHSAYHTQYSQGREFHSLTQRPTLFATKKPIIDKREGHWLSPALSLRLLEAHQIKLAPDLPPFRNEDVFIRIDVNRLSGGLSVSISQSEDHRPDKKCVEVTTSLIEFLTPFEDEDDCQDPKWRDVKVTISSDWPMKGENEYVSCDPSGFVRSLMSVFVHEQCFSLHARLTNVKPGPFFARGGKVKPGPKPVYRVADAQIGLDRLVYQRPEAVSEIQSKKFDRSAILNSEEEAARDGIVFVKLDGPGTIGTLVNGAGLAMNTVDALADLGGHSANFLDTGGKATSATVKTSFQLVISDPRVKVIFVNIFGGLTLCDMIAEGIMLAYKDLGIRVPVVVRLRGTNEEVGQKMIAESGLPLHAFDDFEEAALKAIELARSA